MNYNNHNENEKRRVRVEKTTNSNSMPKLPDGRTVAAETVRVLKLTNANCGKCHYFCSVLSPVSGNTSKDGTRASEVSKTICRLKKHKEIKYYNICDLFKKLSVTELKQESS